MLSKWQWLWSQLTTTLWIRATLFGVIGVIAALLGTVADTFDEFSTPFDVEQGTVDHILEILANSMLMVTTFSLSVMVSAYVAATNNVTPRATRLIRQDTTTQNVLAVFIGAFIFSLVGIIAVKTEVYQSNGTFVLFAFTVLMVVLIIVSIFRWIEHLSLLGRVGSTSQQVEEATTRALQFYRDNPCLGAQLLSDDDHTPQSSQQVYSTEVGYVQHLDVQALEAVAKEANVKVYVNALPGTLVFETRPLASFSGQLSPTQIDKITTAYSIHGERSFEQDPRFGLCVLTEIAQRALSPALNDPGTAIDILSRHLRILAPWRDLQSYDMKHPRCPHVFIPPLQLTNLFEDAFLPIARDAGDMVEVHIRLFKTLGALASQDSPELRQAAQTCASKCLAYAKAGLTLDDDIAVIKQFADRLQHIEPAPTSV